MPEPYREDPFDYSDVEPDDPEVRRVRFVLFLGSIFVLVCAIVFLLVRYQPDTVPFVTRWPNGYPKAETCFVEDTLQPEGRIEHGRHRAWYQSGVLMEEGEHDRGVRVGEWRFYDEAGELDAERSGRFEDGRRVGPLGG